MPMDEISYSLKILGTEVAEKRDGTHEMVVDYQGRRAPATMRQPIERPDIEGLLRGCEAVAQKIFHEEFRLNDQVDLHFSLEEHDGLKIWHTQPSLYIKCSLTMSMKWTCLHLSDTFKTMTTLGVIELPSELSLTGNAVGIGETARVIMDSMASGVEFMGNIMLMRNTIDHDVQAGGSAANRAHHEEAGSTPS